MRIRERDSGTPFSYVCTVLFPRKRAQALLTLAEVVTRPSRVSLTIPEFTDKNHYLCVNYLLNVSGIK